MNSLRYILTLMLSFIVSVTQADNMCSQTSTTSSTGNLYDSGGPTAWYGNSENCGFLIDLSCNSPITLSFSSFNLESGYDYLRVYDGPNDTYTLLLNATGISTPSNVVSTGGQMYVKFTSDATVTRSGFAATWSSAASTTPVSSL